MKKIISVLMSVVLLIMSMSVLVSATNTTNVTYDYEIGDSHYTVEFADGNLTTEEQEMVAGKLLGFNTEATQTYGLGCTLFGHDYKYTTASVITHKARTYSPRCKRETYDVTYCEDCDYTEQTLTGAAYIYCCDED